MGTRQEWGLFFCVLLLMAARVLDWLPAGPADPGYLPCPHPVEIGGAVDAPGLVCSAGPGQGSLARALPRGCAPPGDAPAGTRLLVGRQDGSACGIQQTGMPGQHLFLVARALDPNTASAVDLQAIPGIGPALSQRIVEERAHGGPFAGIEDLGRVRGIGPKTLARMAPYLRFSKETAPGR